MSGQGTARPSGGDPTGAQDASARPAADQTLSRQGCLRPLRIAVIDHGAGNLLSLTRALARSARSPATADLAERVGGIDVRVTRDPAVLLAADAAILPGVGAFAAAMARLRADGLVEPIRAFAQSGRPLFGICAGLQVLFEEGEEFGRHEGLALLSGRVTRLGQDRSALWPNDPAEPETAAASSLKLPHMGWNRWRPVYPHPLFDQSATPTEEGNRDGLGQGHSGAGPARAVREEAGAWAYFVHSYAAEPADESDVAATTEYGRMFPSVVARGNVLATQFHPEKSGAAGLRLLANWLAMVRAGLEFTVWPAVDVLGGRAVRLRNGDPEQATDYGDPVSAARRWLDAGARALHVVDLDGAFQGRPVNRQVIAAIMREARRVGARVQVGGGLRDPEAIQAVLDLGADRAVIGTLALDADAAACLAARFGPDRLVVALDARDGWVTVDGWKTATDVPAVALARRLVRLGVRHVLYTDVSRDGMLSGPNPSALTEVAATGLLVMASGGVRQAADIRQLADVPGVVGAVVGTALYTGAMDLGEALAAGRSREVAGWAASA